MLAVFALLGRTVTTYAAAGVFGDPCCCPNPKVCKCHDHGDPPRDPVMKRCSTEKQITISPTTFAAIAPAIESRAVPQIATAIAHAIPALHDRSIPPPDKPPF